MTARRNSFEVGDIVKIKDKGSPYDGQDGFVEQVFELSCYVRTIHNKTTIVVVVDAIHLENLTNPKHENHT